MTDYDLVALICRINVQIAHAEAGSSRVAEIAVDDVKKILVVVHDAEIANVRRDAAADAYFDVINKLLEKLE